MNRNDRFCILVVEDDKDIREGIAFALRERGYEANCAADGKEALEFLRGPNSRTSLILLDLMMPVMDGWEFRLRQETDPLLRDIPIVIITAGGNVEKKAGNLRAAGWIAKPFRLEALFTAVENALESSEAIAS